MSCDVKKNDEEEKNSFRKKNQLKWKRGEKKEVKKITERKNEDVLKEGFWISNKNALRRKRMKEIMTIRKVQVKKIIKLQWKCKTKKM